MHELTTRFERLLVPRFRPGRPPLMRAVRTALGIAIPLLALALLDHPQLAVFAAAGALLTSVADVDVTYATKARAMLTTLALACAGVACGTLAEPLGWAAAPLLGIWSFVFAFGVLFDTSAIMVAWSATVSFLAGLGLPATHPVAAVPTRVAGIVIGSVWMTFLALAVWPVNPFRPAMRAVAAYYGALADLMRTACRTAPPQPDEVEDSWEERVAAERAAAREAFGRSARAIRAARLTRPTTGPIARHLVALHEEGYVLFGAIVALAEILDGTRRADPRHIPLLSAVADFVEAAEATARAIASALDAGGAPTPSDRLESRLGAVREMTSAARVVSEDGDVDTDASTVVALSQQLRPIAQALDAAAGNTSHLEESQGVPDVDADSPAFLPERIHPIRTVLDNFTWESAAFRHALRMGVTMTAAVLLYSFLDIPKPFWITLAVVSVVKPDLGGTLDTVVQTVAGTIVGCSLAAVLIAVVRTEIGVILLVIPFSMAAILLAYYNNVFFSVGMSPVFVLLSDLSSLGSWRLALIRILNTCIGAALGLVGGYLLWPKSERTVWQNQLAGLIHSLRAFFDDATTCYLDPEGQTTETRQELRNRHRDTGIAISNVRATTQRLLNQPGTKRAPARIVITVSTYTERLRDAVIALAGHAGHLHAVDPPHGLAGFVTVADAALDTLARAAETGEPCPELPDLDSALEDVKDALHGHPQPASAARAVDYGVVLRELGRVAAAVKGIAMGLDIRNVPEGAEVALEAVRP